MSAFRQNMKLWALWIVTSAALLLANPWGGFGWVELAACVGPLFMAVERRIWREPALALGLPAITLLWLADPLAATVPRLLVGWGVYGVGVMLAARAIDGQSELEAIAGRVAFAPLEDDTYAHFEIAVERELGRARRHERPFAILSVAAHPRSLAVDASGALRGALLRELAENRARLELRGLLRDELHVYADVACSDDRVLALVPEIEGQALAALCTRLRDVANERLDFDVQVGIARFPADAVCSDELVAVADRDRTVSRLRGLPEPAPAPQPASGLAPDAQGS